MFRFLPEQASEIAPKIDWIHDLITDLSVFFTVAIVGAMIYFAIKYRERNGQPHETPQIEGSHLLEIIWTVVPTIISAIVAYYGVIYFWDLRAVPSDAMTINVRGQKWKWDFEYDNGKSTTGEFYVPVNKPIKLVMRSRDVLHSFFLPSMRVKSDVIPYRYTYVSFKPVKTGTYQTFCTEYCGDWHSGMLAKLHVVSEQEFERWVNDDSEAKLKSMMKPSDRGKVLYQGKGCNACHSLNGTPGVGPTWLKLYKHEGELSDGSKYIADENYIHNAILQPNLQIVKGYAPNIMPSYAGQLVDSEIDDLIAFMKTLDGSNPEAKAAAAAAPAAAASEADLAKLSPAERGKHWYETKLCATCHSLDGSARVGPSFKGVYGKQHKLTDGSTIVADDAYLTESILHPAAKIVEGYPPAMPAGLVDEKQTADLIEFLKTVK